MFWTVVVTILLVTLPRAIAQTTGATCMASFDWASNSLKQSPCLVAAYLLGTCGDGSYDVPSLPENTHYVGPTTATANSCECNTVVYSLLSACGECQNRTISGWGTWSANCPHLDVGTFPGQIPSGTRVPGWAYLDVKAQDQFDVDLAKQNANSTESFAPQPTSSSTSSSSSRRTTTRPSSTSVAASTTSLVSSSPVTSASSPTATSSSSSSSSSSTTSFERDKRIDKIIGGTIGGVFALFAIGGIALWFYRRQRKRALMGQMLESPVMSQEFTNALPTQAAPQPASQGSLVSPDIVVHSDDTQTQKYPIAT